MLHRTRTILAVASALAAALVAAPAVAQAPAQTPQTPGAPSDTGANARLQQVADTANNIYAVAKYAQGRAQSQSAKNLANQVVSRWQPILTQVNGLAVQRGLKFGAASPTAQKDLQATMQYLGGQNGPAFDHAFIAAEVNGFRGIEQQLKDLREATPGSDAQLKKWLDDTENVSEQSLSDARNARQSFRQEQARTGH